MASGEDRWSHWLREGRYRGLSEAQVERLNSSLNRVRNRTLRGARLRSGQRVLDVGAGTGLLCLEAARRIGADGLALACDISLDAVRECSRSARAQSLGVAAVVGEATALPFPDSSFDRVLTRSVLIYVEDKRSAIREFRRVLRPGGRVSVFEPINRASPFGPWNKMKVAPEIEGQRKRVIEHIRGNWEHERAMMAFDERDLVKHFLKAGFSEVKLSYEFTSAVRSMTHEQTASLLTMRGNPTALTYEEAARAVLGLEASEHLERIAVEMSSRPGRQTGAVAYLTARV